MCHYVTDVMEQSLMGSYGYVAGYYVTKKIVQSSTILYAISYVVLFYYKKLWINFVPTFTDALTHQGCVKYDKMLNLY